MQVSDFRHGIRRVAGNITGELAPGSYSDIFAALVRREFAAVTAITGMTVTAVAGPPGTFTRTGGDFVSDGLKVGDVIRFTGFTAGAAANNLRNYRILSLTQTVITVSGIGTEVVAAVASASSIGLSVVGKKTYAPLSGHTDVSFTAEHWFSDIAQSERFLGCKPTQIDVGMPATGMVTFASSVIGKDVQTGTSAYFTDPTAAATTGVLAAVNGLLRVNGADVGFVTGANFSLTGNHSADPVIGSNSIPAVFPGTIAGRGNFSAYFLDGALRDAFIAESEISLQIMMTVTSALNSDFVSFYFPRIKLGGAQKSDGQKGIVQSIPFTALENGSGNSDRTTVVIQDSLAA
jgi:hypothetical protein